MKKNKMVFVLLNSMERYGSMLLSNNSNNFLSNRTHANRINRKANMDFTIFFIYRYFIFRKNIHKKASDKITCHMFFSELLKVIYSSTNQLIYLNFEPERMYKYHTRYQRNAIGRSTLFVYILTI